jgi:hypothetical protein
MGTFSPKGVADGGKNLFYSLTELLENVSCYCDADAVLLWAEYNR